MRCHDRHVLFYTLGGFVASAKEFVNMNRLRHWARANLSYGLYWRDREVRVHVAHLSTHPVQGLVKALVITWQNAPSSFESERANIASLRITKQRIACEFHTRPVQLIRSVQEAQSDWVDRFQEACISLGIDPRALDRLSERIEEEVAA